MCNSFTRQQLLDSLLQEVNRAQAGFQAAQLACWRELVPGSALPAAGEIASVESLELQLVITPYRPPWYQRLYRWLRRQQPASGEAQFRLSTHDHPASQRLTLRIARGKDGFTAEAAALS